MRTKFPKLTMDVLNVFDWFPVDVSNEAKDIAVNEHGEKLPNAAVFVTSIKNVFSGNPRFSHLCGFTKSWNIFMDHEAKRRSMPVFDFPESISDVSVAALMMWMSETKTFYCTVQDMIGIYTALATDTNILPLLERDAPLVWIPRQLEGHSIRIGDMYPLTALAKDDPTGRFDEVSCGVKTLAAYRRVDAGSLQLFAPTKYCSACQALEGMYGTIGSRKDLYFGKQKCACLDNSVGLRIKHLTYRVKNSPSLMDNIKLIQYYRDLYLESSSGTIIRKDMQEKFAQKYRNLLEPISREIWKCFHIDWCLHAYSAESMRAMQEVFRQEKLLFTIDGLFVSAEPEGKTLLVVDDKSLFAAFENDLKSSSQCQEQVRWIDGARNHGGIFSDEVYDDKSVSYDIEEFESRCRAFVELDPHLFQDKAGTIPPETFFAPQSMLSLLRLLGISEFSKFVVVEWNIGDLSPESVGFTSTFNELLRISQMFLLAQDESCSLVPILTNKERLQKLLGLRVFESNDLNRTLTLHIPEVGVDIPNRLQKQKYYLDTEKNMLFIDKGLQFSDVGEISIQMILKAARVEMALLKLNQNVELMAKLKGTLEKFLRVPPGTMVSDPQKLLCLYL